MKLQEILQKLKATQTGDHSWKAHCPAHGDTNASLSITEKGGKILLHCLAGCDWRAVIAAAGIEAKDLFAESGSKPGMIPFKYGLTLAKYADAKKFNIEQLRQWGLNDGTYTTQKGQQYPGVAMPYKDAADNVTAIRWRMRITKEQGTEPSRFLWGKGGRLSLYGLWHLGRDEDSVILVEGESDCHALWGIGANALGIPGADHYKADRDDPEIEFFDKIFVHIERDTGGKTFFKRFAGSDSLLCRKRDEKYIPPSRLLHKIQFFSLTGYKDPSEAWTKLHDQPEEFRRIIGAGIRMAKPASKFEQPACWKEDPAKAKTPDGRAAASPANGEKGGRPQADYIGLARAYCNRHRDQQQLLTLRHWRNTWYQFNGHCYKPRLDVDIESQATAWLQNPKVAEEYHVQPSTNALRNLLLGLRSASCCGIPAETEAPSWLSAGKPADGWIAMGNTLINIEEAARAHFEAIKENSPISLERMQEYTRPLSPELLSTFALAYNYDPAADCPKFREWLSTTQPNPEVQSAMLMLMGLALVPDTSYNVCFFLSGDGGTGKSTFLDMLQALVGSENTCRVPLLKMEDRFSTWPLAESLLNVVGEMPTDDPQGRLRYIEGDFKDSISGGMITIERKGKDICTARCTARHVFATNSLPIFFDKSEGIWDRLIIIPFEQRFRGMPGEVRNIRDTIIPDELPGIFNLALYHLAELRNFTRFPEPDACRNMKQYHRDRCDFDAAYLNDFYRLDSNAETTVSSAYEHYRTQLLANGLAPRSSPTFQAAIARVFGVRPVKRSRTDTTRVFKGLAASYSQYNFNPPETL